ncbi:hypothetical protein [Azospirillum cavernae]|uniref:hypothetical protein n=1 Tax=Azospirillum cavernae TaxID=2320860 RepID=UPI0011C3E7E6|nr:hypothetical protein [Azospirillum cavernae]
MLNDVSLTADPGSFVAVVGPRDRQIDPVPPAAGVRDAGAGTVSFDGQSLADVDPASVRRNSAWCSSAARCCPAAS